MGNKDTDNLFNVLNENYEIKLNTLTEERNVSTKMYRADALQFMEDRIGEYGSETFLEKSTQLLESEFTFIRTETVLSGRFDKNLYLSLCYHQLASIMPDRGRLADGCKYLQEAMYYCGLWQGAREHKEWVEEKEKKEVSRHENAKEGKRRKDVPIKAEIIRLLHSKMPVEGWCTKSNAIENIQTELKAFIEETTGKSLSEREWNSLPRKIKDWSRNDDAVKLAFVETLSRKRSSGTA